MLCTNRQTTKVNNQGTPTPSTWWTLAKTVANGSKQIGFKKQRITHFRYCLNKALYNSIKISINQNTKGKTNSDRKYKENCLKIETVIGKVLTGNMKMMGNVFASQSSTMRTTICSIRIRHEATTAEEACQTFHAVIWVTLGTAKATIVASIGRTWKFLLNLIKLKENTDNSSSNSRPR